MTLTERIKSRALETGFDSIGIAPARSAPHAAAYREWLEKEYHADMRWMAKNTDRRTDPREIVEGARTVLSLGTSYYIEDPPSEFWDDPSRGRIARYAWGPDYHDVITKRLKALVAFIQSERPGAVTRYYVDTGPVLEREAAWQSGQGFIGRNSLFIHPEFGSMMFLAEIITDLDLEPDPPAEDEGATWTDADGTPTGTCGSCRRCLDICPTHAFPSSYILDSNLCISYLTIEHRESIPEPLRPKLGNWIFGCDLCQTVCPWVRQYAKPGRDAFLAFDPDTCAPRLDELLRMDDETFRVRFKGRAIKRTKRRGLLRNAAVAAGNAGDPALLPALRHAAKDQEPLIREHADWAIQKLHAPR